MIEDMSQEDEWWLDTDLPDDPIVRQELSIEQIFTKFGRQLGSAFKVSLGSFKRAYLQGARTFIIHEPEERPEKGVPTVKLKEILRKQKERGNELRDWMQGRAIEAGTRSKEESEAYYKSLGSRGIDRVPDRYRVHVPAPEMLTEHRDLNYMQRRQDALQSRRRDVLGRIEKVRVRPGMNEPYYSPRR